MNNLPIIVSVCAVLVLVVARLALKVHDIDRRLTYLHSVVVKQACKLPILLLVILASTVSPGSAETLTLMFDRDGIHSTAVTESSSGQTTLTITVADDYHYADAYRVTVRYPYAGSTTTARSLLDVVPGMPLTAVFMVPYANARNILFTVERLKIADR